MDDFYTFQALLWRLVSNSSESPIACICFWFTSRFYTKCYFALENALIRQGANQLTYYNFLEFVKIRKLYNTKQSHSFFSWFDNSRNFLLLQSLDGLTAVCTYLRWKFGVSFFVLHRIVARIRYGKDKI